MTVSLHIHALCCKFDSSSSFPIVTTGYNAQFNGPSDICLMGNARLAIVERYGHRSHFCCFQVFVPRVDENRQLRSLVLPRGLPHPVLVLAPSGSGKSSFLAFALRKLRDGLGWMEIQTSLRAHKCNDRWQELVNIFTCAMCRWQVVVRRKLQVALLLCICRTAR